MAEARHRTTSQRETARESPSEATKPLVVVTGAAGLIGSALIEALTGDYRVAALDVEKRPGSSRAQWIECDLTSDRSTSRAFESLPLQEGETIASVVHLAGYYDFTGEPSPLYRSLTVEGTRRVLQQLTRLRESKGVSCQQFVFSSTLLVMSPANEGERLTESSPTRAEWDYPRSKLRAETVIASERGPVPATILRIGGVYDDDCHSIPIAQQIRRIYEKRLESHFFPGNPEHAQSFVHLDDLVRCLRLTIALRTARRGCEVFLIGEPESPSYEELQENLGRLLHGREWRTLAIPKTVAKAGAWVRHRARNGKETLLEPWMMDLADDHYPIAVDKAKSVLGWTPRHRLLDSLPRMVERLMGDPRRWYEENSLAVGRAPYEEVEDVEEAEEVEATAGGSGRDRR